MVATTRVGETRFAALSCATSISQGPGLSPGDLRVHVVSSAFAATDSKFAPLSGWRQPFGENSASFHWRLGFEPSRVYSTLTMYSHRAFATPKSGHIVNESGFPEWRRRLMRNPSAFTDGRDSNPLNHVFPPAFAIPKSAHNSTASITSTQCAALSPPAAKAAINSNT